MYVKSIQESKQDKKGIWKLVVGGDQFVLKNNRDIHWVTMHLAIRAVTHNRILLQWLFLNVHFRIFKMEVDLFLSSVYVLVCGV